MDRQPPLGGRRPIEPRQVAELYELAAEVRLLPLLEGDIRMIAPGGQRPDGLVEPPGLQQVVPQREAAGVVPDAACVQPRDEYRFRRQNGGVAPDESSTNPYLGEAGDSSARAQDEAVQPSFSRKPTQGNDSGSIPLGAKNPRHASSP